MCRLAENRSAVVLSVRFAPDVEQVVRDVRFPEFIVINIVL